jgi:tetratricopeptide (TPR) repeat protein
MNQNILKLTLLISLAYLQLSFATNTLTTDTNSTNFTSTTTVLPQFSSIILPTAEEINELKRPASDLFQRIFNTVVAKLLELMQKAEDDFNTALSQNPEWKQLFDRGRELEASREYDKALEDYQACLQLAIRLYPGQKTHQSRLNSLLAIGYLYQYRKSDPLKAVEYLEQALTGIKDAGLHVHYSGLLLNLGTLKYNLGEYDAAINYFEESMDTSPASLKGVDYEPFIVAILTRTGFAYFITGRYKQALDYAQRAQTMGQRALKYDDLELARLASNLGRVHVKLGNTADALTHYLHAYEILNRIQPSDEQTTLLLTNMLTLGMIYQDLGHVIMATDYFRRSLEASINVNLPEFNRVAGAALILIGRVIRNRGELNEAFNYFSEGLLKLQLYLEGDNKQVADLLYEIGDCLAKMQNNAKSIEYHEKSYEMRQKLHGADQDHPDLASSLYYIGLGWHHQGDSSEKALPYFEKCYEMRRRLYKNQDNNELLEVLFVITDSLISLDRPSDALPYAEQSLTMATNLKYETTSIQIIRGLLNLGAVMTKMGRYDEAESFLTRVNQTFGLLDKATQALSNYSGLFYNTQIEFVRLYEERREYDKAIEMTLNEIEALETGRLKEPTPTHLKFPKLFSKLAGFYNCTGEHLNAVKYYEKALHLVQRLDLHYYAGVTEIVANLLYRIGTQYEGLRDLKRGLEYYIESLRAYQSAGKMDLRDENFVALMHAMNRIKEKINDMPIKENDFHSDELESVNHFREEL